MRRKSKQRRSDSCTWHKKHIALACLHQPWCRLLCFFVTVQHHFRNPFAALEASVQANRVWHHERLCEQAVQGRICWKGGCWRGGRWCQGVLHPICFLWACSKPVSLWWILVWGSFECLKYCLFVLLPSPQTQVYFMHCLPAILLYAFEQQQVSGVVACCVVLCCVVSCCVVLCCVVCVCFCTCVCVCLCICLSVHLSVAPWN